MLRVGQAFGWAAVLLLFVVAKAGAEAVPPPTTPEGVLSFANGLLRSGESFRAVTEYLRFLHHFPADPGAPSALEGLGSSYAQAGRWGEAASAFAQLVALAPTARNRHLLGSALYQGGQYPEAARVLLSPGSEDADLALGTLALLRTGVSEPLPSGARGDVAREYESLPKKSPAMAGALSAVLPGAGLLYAGRPRDAALSFVVNGVFLWGIYESARRDQWALVGILGLFEAGWYGGNVATSANAAHKWNRREGDRFFHKWEAGALPQWGLTLGPGTAGATLAWRW